MNSELNLKLKKFMKELGTELSFPHVSNLTKHEEVELNYIWGKLRDLTKDKICCICEKKINQETDCSISYSPNWWVGDFRPVAEVHQTCYDKIEIKQ